MKKYLDLLLGLLILNSGQVSAQRTCGFQQQLDAVSSHNPTFATHMQAYKASLQSRADQYKLQLHSGDRSTSSAAPVPVIFHILVNSSQLANLGGLAGIRQRCDSQIAVLNRDYNRQNPDSTAIPSLWRPYYASVGIQFALATIDPSGTPCVYPGIDLQIITTTGFSAGSTTGYFYPDRYAKAKHTSLGGVDAWDVNLYMNVWCINFSDNVNLLGTTIAKSWTPAGGCDTTSGYACPANDDEGICINYESLGKRASPSDLYPAGIFDEGRTLTHEVGHFFEIWHVWGDDGGRCPWNGGADDGIQDTPPQGSSTSGNPTYTIPGGTIKDTCEDSSGVLMQSRGIACLDYLDYTDDAGMHLFTTDQAAVMASMVDRVGGENYNLVRYPALTAAVPVITPSDQEFLVTPNPATGLVSILFDRTKATLNDVQVIDRTGRIVVSADANNNSGIMSLDLRGLAKGFYFVRCNFAAGSDTRKILLQ